MDAKETFEKVLEALDTLPADATMPVALKTVLAKHKKAKALSDKVGVMPPGASLSATTWSKSKPLSVKKPGCTCPACQLLDDVLAEPGVKLQAAKNARRTSSLEFLSTPDLSGV
jgi:hypothetical protein